MFSDPTGRMTMVEVTQNMAIVGLVAAIAIPQVFQMGITAARTVIAAGLEGAEQIRDGISGQLVALTLAYEKMKAGEKAKARPLADLRRDPAVKKAVIGENLLRTIPASVLYSAETFTPGDFFGGPLPDFPLQNQGEFNLWMWANRAWIRSVMARQLLVIDIGPNITRVFLGRPISPFYGMEVSETTGYPLKIYEPWPPVPILL